ncbi:CHASE4 domain-containing protein [Methanolacinia paynteri]|uniref:CHASE4 domain-containing protein n=1 Tax=Methanolacinia paynteri TaxID=230356 RepID=UPI00064E80F6|nr:CHASE4 domain-containing protein [Methanolacinia paynteri]
MTLRRKLLTAAIIITFFTILSVSIFTQFIFLDQVRDFEEESAGQELQGLAGIINERIRSEEIAAAGWSTRDDTYEFVRDGNEDFIRSALGNQTFLKGKVNIMLFLDERGDVVYGHAFDPDDDTMTGIPEDFKKSLIDHGILYNHTSDFESSAGIIVLNESVMLVSEYPITGTGEGPAKGVLIRGTYIDSEELAEETGSKAVSFTIGGTHSYAAGSTYSPEDDGIIFRIDEGSSPGDPGRIHAAATTYDLYGDPVLLEIEMERITYVRGFTALIYTILAIIVTGIVFAAAYLTIIRKSVFMQVERLGRDASEIAENKDPGRRIDFEGDPEFMRLAESINKMLCSLEDATCGKMESEMKYVDLFDSSLDGIVLTDLEGIILDANPAFLNMSGIAEVFKENSNRSVCLFGVIEKECNPDAVERMLDLWEKENKPFKFETGILNLKTGILPVEITSWPLSDKNEIIKGLWWLVRDISEKRAIEEIRSNAVSRIEDNLEKMAILNDEIRNPLAIIVGLAEIKCGAASEEIIRQVEKIDQIINLLDRGWLSSKKVHEFLKKQYIQDEELKRFQK